jgi:TIR domain-containing protein
MGEIQEIQYFFSYAREDAEFVLKLARELRAVGANLWVDQLDILGGQRWDRAVGDALESSQGMIAVLSPNSLASNNVMDEVSYALEEGKLVVPVLIRPCELPFRLRRVQHIDFTAEYATGFSQLLRALRIKQPPVTIEPSPPTEQGAQRIEEPLAGTSTTVAREPPEVHVTPDMAPKPPMEVTVPTRIPRARLKGALVGAAVGVIWGAIAMVLTGGRTDDWLIGAGVVGTAGAITGAISGKQRLVVLVAISGLVVGFIIWLMVDSEMEVFRLRLAAVVGAPLGAIVGAIIGALIQTQKRVR